MILTSLKGVSKHKIVETTWNISSFPQFQAEK